MILGITGTIGAGKGTVVEYLVNTKGFTHYSVREAITEEIIRRGLPVNRTTLNEVATDLRKKNKPDYYTTIFFERAEREGVTNAIMESIRNPLEAENIKRHGGFILVVDADEQVRYWRISNRGTETDNVSFEEFQQQEAREMTSEDPSDPSYMDMGAVIRMADTVIMNNGTLKALHEQIEEALNKLH